MIQLWVTPQETREWGKKQRLEGKDGFIWAMLTWESLGGRHRRNTWVGSWFRLFESLGQQVKKAETLIKSDY